MSGLVSDVRVCKGVVSIFPRRRSRFFLRKEFEKTRPYATEPGEPTVNSTKRFLWSTAANINEITDVEVKLL